MSHVNNYMICALEGEWDDARKLEFAATLTPPLWRNRGSPFVLVSDLAGGGKAVEADVWMAAFNGLEPTDLLNHLRTIEWDHPEDVQLIIKEQDDEQWRAVLVFPEAQVRTR